jgi:predicted nuclease of restriction endonuclease-like (RecB) superfamily
LGDALFEDHNVFRDQVDAALKKAGTKLPAAELKLILKAVSWRVETAPPVIAKVHKAGKTTADPMLGLYDAVVAGKPCVVEYEPDSDLRDTEQVPLLEEGGIEAFIRREVLPYTPECMRKATPSPRGRCHQVGRRRATELIGLYWQIGEYISGKLAAAEWGEGVVDRLAQHLARTVPGLRGFSAQNLWRMRQLFDTYRDDPKLSPLVRALPWTHNLIILGQSKRAEEREFYLRMAVQQRWGKRELERQIRLAAFEKAVLTPPKLSPAVREMHGDAATSALQGRLRAGVPGAAGRPHRGRPAPRPAGKLRPSSSSWAATSASSARSSRCRWAGATLRSTCCSSTAA